MAVPLVTTSCIMGRRPSTIFGLIGAVLPDTVVGRPSMSCGSGVLPAATVAYERHPERAHHDLALPEAVLGALRQVHSGRHLSR